MRRLLILVALLLVPSLVTAQNTVQVWKRHNITFGSTNCGATNPDRVEWEVTFTHDDGTAITMPGYHTGTTDQYAVNFMPTKTGNWSWASCSSVGGCNTVDANACANLDGLTSTSATEVSAVDSTLNDGVTAHPGKLITEGRKWKFSDSGDYVLPLGLRTYMFFEHEADTTTNPLAYDTNHPDFILAADYLKQMGFNYIETNLYDEEGHYDSSGDYTTGSGDVHRYVYEGGDFTNYDFAEFYWQRFQERMDILTERGLGVQLMFYTDDGGRPCFYGLGGTGEHPSGCPAGAGDDGGVAEKLLIRHTIARTAANPFVMYNYMIDYTDGRNPAEALLWINEVKAMDPYDHPISVRHKDPPNAQVEIAGQTYDSDGEIIVPSSFTDLRRTYNRETNSAVSFDDGWWQLNESCILASRRGDGESARRGAWKNLIFGTGAFFRGGSLTGTCGPSGSSVCDANTPQRYFWFEDNGSGTQSCLQDDIAFYTPSTLEGIAQINALIANETRGSYGSMEPETSSYNSIEVATGDVKEWSIFDHTDPDVIIIYSAGVDDNVQNDSDECPTCGGDVEVTLTNPIFSTRRYAARWLNPRTGVYTVATPSEVSGGTITNFTPPSDASDDWVLLLSPDFFVDADNGADVVGCGRSSDASACATLGYLLGEVDLGGNDEVRLAPGIYHEVDPTTGDGVIHTSADDGDVGNPVTVRCDGDLGDCIITGLWPDSSDEQLDAPDIWTPVAGTSCVYETNIPGSPNLDDKGFILLETAGELLTDGYTVCDYGTAAGNDIGPPDCPGQVEGSPCDYCEGEFGAPTTSVDGDGHQFSFTFDTGLTLWNSDRSGSTYVAPVSDAVLDASHGSFRFSPNASSPTKYQVRTYFCQDPDTGVNNPGIRGAGDKVIHILASNVIYEKLVVRYGLVGIQITGTHANVTLRDLDMYGFYDNAIFQTGGSTTNLTIQDVSARNLAQRSPLRGSGDPLGSLVDGARGAIISTTNDDNSLFERLNVSGGWQGVNVKSMQNSVYRDMVIGNIFNHPLTTDNDDGTCDGNLFERIALYSSQDDSLRLIRCTNNIVDRFIGDVFLGDATSGTRLRNSLSIKISPVPVSGEDIDYVGLNSNTNCSVPSGPSQPCGSAGWITAVGAGSNVFDTSTWVNDALNVAAIDFDDELTGLDIHTDPTNSGYTRADFVPAVGATDLIDRGDPDIDRDGTIERPTCSASTTLPCDTTADCPGVETCDTVTYPCPASDDCCTIANNCTGLAPDLGAFEFGIESTGGEAPECNDGIDNDNDGGIDLLDNGCANSDDNSERGSDVCDDGDDNDGDGNTDYPADSTGCTGPTDASERAVIGVAPLACDSGTDTCECDDADDNDADTFFDYPDDNGCTGPSDNSETTAQCSDGLDNDGDGRVDLADIGCSDASDITEGTLAVPTWDIPCTSDAWFQALDDSDTVGGFVTINLNSATYPCTTITVNKDATADCAADPDCGPYANELLENNITINGNGVIFEPELADQWWNRDICGAGVACDSDSNGHPDLCPTSEEQDPRFLTIRTDNNVVQNLTFRWYGDGITFDDEGIEGINTEAKGNTVDNVHCEHPADNCFRNEGDIDNDGMGSLNCGTDPKDCSAQNNIVQNSSVLNACDKSFQTQGRETDVSGAFASVDDYDMILDNVTCTNCNQGVRMTFEGRTKVNDATWVYDAGQIPAGTGSGLYVCDSAIRISSDCGSGSQTLCAALTRVTGGTSLSGCGDNIVLVQGYGQVIVEGAGNSVFDGSADAFEVQDQGKLSISDTAIQNNNPRGIFWNTLSTSSKLECGTGGSGITFTQPDGNVSSTGGNTFSSNEVWDIAIALNPQTMECAGNTFDCPQPPNPKLDGSIVVAPQAGSCGAAQAGSVIRGVKLEGVKAP